MIKYHKKKEKKKKQLDKEGTEPSVFTTKIS